MAVSIVPSTTISGDTFYRNKFFDISFAVSCPDYTTSYQLCNTYAGLKPYVSNNQSFTGSIPTTGFKQYLTVDVLTNDTGGVVTLSNAAPFTYVGADGACSDPSGNVYFVHTNSHTINKIDPSGTITLFAGTSNVSGYTNGDRLSATFNSPTKIIRDVSTGTFYVTELWHLCKIDPSGIVSRICGSTTSGTADGFPADARFLYPGAMALDPAGNVYICDADNHAVRKVNPMGIVTTYAGTLGSAGDANGARTTSSILGIDSTNGWVFSSTDGIWWSGPSATLFPSTAGTFIQYGGDMYVAGGFDPVNPVKVSVDGVNWSNVGAPVTYPARTAAFASNQWVVGGGPLFIGGTNTLAWSSNGTTWTGLGTSIFNRTCRRVVYENGVWMAVGQNSHTLARSLDGRTWTPIVGVLSPVAGIGFDVTYGNGVWIAVGTGASNIAVSADNGLTWTSQTIGSGTFVSAIGYNAGLFLIATDNGSSGCTVYGSTNNGTSWSVYATSTSFPGMTVPASELKWSSVASKWRIGGTGADFVSSDGIVWVKSTLDLAGTTDRTVATGTQLTFPAGVVLSNSTLYVSDQYNNKIKAVTDTTVTTYAGTGAYASIPGPRLSAAIARPTISFLDPSGTLYVASFETFTLHKIDPAGTVSLVSGTFGVSGYQNGAARNALYNGIGGLAYTSTGIYIVEVFNGSVRKIVFPVEVSPFSGRPAGYTITATSNYPITVNSRIDVSWTSVGGVLPLFKFEPFSNTFTVKPAVLGDTLTYSSTSTELLGYMTGTGTSSVAFRGPNGATTAYPYALNLIVQANSNGVVVDDISTSVTIDIARLVYSPCNSTLSFYRNEPISPVAFSILCNAASNIYSGTTLPTGLSFTRTASNTFTLGGTPTVQSVSSNYTIFGQDTSGRTYTAKVSMLVNPERVLIDVSGSTSITGILSNVPIAPVTFKALFPPYGQFRAITYSWTAPPPAGIQFFRSNGDAVFGTTATISTLNDASFSLTLAGTITQAQVEAFAAANISNYSISLTATRSAGGTPLSPSVPTTINFALAPVLLFTSNVPRTFVNLPVSNWSYTAKTYFADVSVSSIAVTAGFLPDGLVGTFNSAAQRFDISGTPTTVASYSFTLTAIAGSYSATLPVSLTTSNDRAFFRSAVDTCYNFIQYRALSNAKSGYYSAPIEYDVSCDSGNLVTLTGTSLPDGVTLDVCGSTYRLSGIPMTATGLTTATLTASVAASGVSDTSTFRYSVSAEVFTFDASAFSFIQNVPMTPQQVIATTFSEQQIVRYSATGLPPSLTVTNTGLVSGTVEGSNSGTFTVSAFTAYSSGSKTYSYTVTPDQVLLVPSTYSLATAPGCNVSIPITGYSLSATTVSNYRFQVPFSYGLGINSTTGLLSGTLASSLPASTTFTLVGNAGLVDGSLEGTMTTNNLTVNRAQILRNDWANFFPDVSTLYVYSSDDNGLVWTKRLAISNSVYASTIGSNGSNLYLIPTSSQYVLRSSNTTTFTSNDYDASSNTPHATSIVNKPGTSTWWMVGTSATGVSTRGTFLYTTTDDGVTWTSNAITAASARDKNLLSSGQWTPYINGGAALAYKDGVLLFGGTQILRSTDEGQTWSTVTGGFTKEVGFFSLDHETVWIATGSDTYETLSNAAWTGTTANTICYSTDAGLTWTYAANGFNMNGYGVVRGPNAWMAYGLCNVYPSYSLYTMVSFDGVNWSTLSALPAVNGPIGGTVRPDALRMTLAFDETDWIVLAPTSDTTVARYSHPYDTPLTTGWTSNDSTSQFPGFGSNTLLTSYGAEVIDPGADTTTITFPLPNNGPTFVSPAQSTYVVWQYMPVPGITFTASGTAPISYFISSLPVGLSWNSTTRTVSGTCMRTGTQTFTVYAKDGLGGVTAFTVTLIVEVPRIIKKQTSAGAYTSLVRQYTEVNAAQTARDSRALPDQTTGIGEFASPYPPSVVTPSNCPC